MIVVFPFWFRLLRDKRYRATTLWPFIILRSPDLKENAKILNHERIHLAQQVETLLILFLLIYFLEYLYYRWQGKKHHEAYLSISSEREAYRHDSDLNYLTKRRAYANFRTS